MELQDHGNEFLGIEPLHRALIKRDGKWDNLKAFIEKQIEQEQTHEKSASFRLKPIYENTQNMLFKVREQMRIIENQQ